MFCQSWIAHFALFFDWLNFICPGMFDCVFCWYKILDSTVFPWKLQTLLSCLWHGGSLCRSLRSIGGFSSLLPGLLFLLECFKDCFCTRMSWCWLLSHFFLNMEELLTFRFTSLYIKLIFFYYILENFSVPFILSSF